MLRIISGEKRGRLLKTPEGRDTRPTSDRVKESLFNILQGRMAAARVLDLFAGSGSLGLEALSRGAGHAVFVEKDLKAASILRSNCEGLAYGARTEILVKDAAAAVTLLAECGDSFDVILMDPPYDRDLEAPILKAVSEGFLLNPEGVFVLEHLSRDPMPDSVASLVRMDCRKYGNTSISFYQRGGA